VFDGLLQPGHLLLILAIALVVFGPKRLPELGKGLGQAIRGFKAGLNDGDAQNGASPSRPADDKTPQSTEPPAASRS
jgi:sec-independent protein translocase protein TatA